MTLQQESYAHGHHESVLKSHEWRTAENSAAYLLDYLEPGASLLDVGCGPGTMTIDFAERLLPGTVTGVDASEEVIGKAAALAAERGIANAEFLVANAYSLPFADDTFDVVHTHQTLHHVADPSAVLREMRRVVKPGGVVAAREVDYSGTIWFPQIRGLDDWMALYQRVHRSHGGEPDSGRRLQAWALAAGFERVVSTASIWNFADAVDREWWGSMWESRVLQSAFAEDAVGNGFAVQSELEVISRAWRQWADSPEGWLGMPHGEVLCFG
ncbi:MAG: class I SAM-dependent methyltransferase [Microbacteriaceae bacterium]